MRSFLDAKHLQTEILFASALRFLAGAAQFVLQLLLLCLPDIKRVRIRRAASDLGIDRLDHAIVKIAHTLWLLAAPLGARQPPQFATGSNTRRVPSVRVCGPWPGRGSAFASERMSQGSRFAHHILSRD